MAQVAEPPGQPAANNSARWAAATVDGADGTGAASSWGDRADNQDRVNQPQRQRQRDQRPEREELRRQVEQYADVLSRMVAERRSLDSQAEQLRQDNAAMANRLGSISAAAASWLLPTKQVCVSVCALTRSWSRSVWAWCCSGFAGAPWLKDGMECPGRIRYNCIATR